MFKRFVTFLVAIVVGLFPVASRAADLTSAFSGLIGQGSAATFSSGGNYSNGARNIFVGGSTEIRFPRSNATLFSVTPPGYSAGCQGISAHFGGFSFIGGAQIEQLVRNIAQGAPGLVINMVIKTLCPMCEAVLQNMQKLAQAAAATNINSCRAASHLAEMLTGSKKDATSNGQSDSVSNACSARASSTGLVSDFGEGMSSICQSLSDAVGTLNKGWKSVEEGLYGSDGKPVSDPAKRQAKNADYEKCLMGVGNCTWLVLSQMYPTLDGSGNPLAGINPNEVVGKRILLMNLVGATVMGPGASCGDNTTVQKTKDDAVVSTHCLPKLDVKQAVGLFMCGDGKEVTKDDKVWQSYCGQLFGNKSIPDAVSAVAGLELMDCRDDTGADPYKACPSLKVSKVSELGSYITGRGFLLDTTRLLKEAVKRVRNNIPMGQDQTGRDIIALINIAPYPLYQAINAAAVYPDAGNQLVESLGALVADHIAYAYFSQFLSRSADTTWEGVRIAPEMVERLSAAMNSLTMEAEKNTGRMGKQLATQQMVMEEIRKVNQVIQQSVMSEQMLNMQKYANTINTQAAAQQ